MLSLFWWFCITNPPPHHSLFQPKFEELLTTAGTDIDRLHPRMRLSIRINSGINKFISAPWIRHRAQQFILSPPPCSRYFLREPPPSSPGAGVQPMAAERAKNPGVCPPPPHRLSSITRALRYLNPSPPLRKLTAANAAGRTGAANYPHDRLVEYEGAGQVSVEGRFLGGGTLFLVFDVFLLLIWKSHKPNSLSFT